MLPTLTCHLVIGVWASIEEQSAQEQIKDPVSEIKSTLRAYKPEEPVVTVLHHYRHHPRALTEGFISGNRILTIVQRNCPSSMCLQTERDKIEAERCQKEIDTTK